MKHSGGSMHRWVAYALCEATICALALAVWIIPAEGMHSTALFLWSLANFLLAITIGSDG